VRPAGWTWPATAAHTPRLSERLGLSCRLREPVGVALTFDDGPHPAGTPAVLELLEEAGARATFFLVGEQVARWPSLAAEIKAAGHEVGVHGYRHRLLLRRGLLEIADDYDRALDAIAGATGSPPQLYRPPYGVFSGISLELVRRRRWTPLLWSKWGRDWSALQSPSSIARRVTRGLEGGDVVLLHDADHYSAPGSWMRTAAALPAIFAAAARLEQPLVAAGVQLLAGRPSAAPPP